MIRSVQLSGGGVVGVYMIRAAQHADTIFGGIVSTAVKLCPISLGLTTGFHWGLSDR